MKCKGDSQLGLNRNCYKSLSVVVFVLCFSIVVSQNFNSGSGIPLPILKEGQSQGRSQSTIFIPSDKNVQNSNGLPLVVTLEDNDSARDSVSSGSFGISLPGLGFKSERDSILNSNVKLNTARGPGSLQHIKDPSQDGNVLMLLNHPLVKKTIQKETSADSAVKIDSVITAHKQVVSGQIIYLDLKVVETKCSIGSQYVENCEVDTNEDPYICEVAVWQRSWLNSTKVIDEKTRCAEMESDNEFKNWNKGNSGLRPLTRRVALRTLPSYLNEDQVALEAYDYVDRGSESKFKGQLINYSIGEIKSDNIQNITSIDVSVEYGFTMCLKFPNRKVDDRLCPIDIHRDNYICKVTVISDPSLTTNLKVLPDDDEDIKCQKLEPVNEELVVPVKAVCMGCPQTLSLNDPTVLRIAEIAITQYDRSSDEDELHTLVKLHKAQTQVVNGIKYFLTLELAETDCRKPLSAVNINRTLCNVDITDEPDICEIVILEQPWQNSQELITAKCYDKKNYPPNNQDEFIVPIITDGGFGSSGFAASESVGVRPALGLFQPSSPLTADLPAEMQESINFLLDAVNRIEVEDLDDGLYKILNVLKADTANEASGQVDTIVLELGETICKVRNLSSNCPLKPFEEPEICTGKVLRGQQLSLLLLRCDDDREDHLHQSSSGPHYVKTKQPFFTPQSLGLPGGLLEQPTNSSLISEISHFVVDQYNLQNDDDEVYKLGKILSAFSQLAGSVSYIVEIELIETKCKKYQPLIDVSRCPVEYKEEPEICQAEVSINYSSGSSSGTTKQLSRIFCDERDDFYFKKLAKTSTGETTHGEWQLEETTSSKVENLGKLVADEFDFRSDEDNIFVLFKVLESKTQSPGLAHQVRVELAETVCPKYKEKINKTRCAIDIGEEHKICEALVSERPWKKDHEVTKLSCFERGDSREEDDESHEIEYRQVHPSAHARPKFIDSRYKVRHHSKESEESNEKYYKIRDGTVARRDDNNDDGGGEDSDEALNIDHRLGNVRNLRSRRVFQVEDDDDEQESDALLDNESKSNEGLSRLRIRRQVKSNSDKLDGAPISIDVNDKNLHELAKFSLAQIDELSDDPRSRKLVTLLKASSQMVAGILWNLKFETVFTLCPKGSTEAENNISTCLPDPNNPVYICDVTIWEKGWDNFKKVTESNCLPKTN